MICSTSFHFLISLRKKILLKATGLKTIGGWTGLWSCTENVTRFHSPPFIYYIFNLFSPQEPARPAYLFFLPRTISLGESSARGSTASIPDTPCSPATSFRLRPRSSVPFSMAGTPRSLNIPASCFTVSLDLFIPTPPSPTTTTTTTTTTAAAATTTTTDQPNTQWQTQRSPACSR